MTPVLRVDDEVYEALKKKAIPFEDTPNSVLRRILGLAGSTSTRPRQTPKRAPRGSSTPKREYYIPILEAVAELSGKAEAREALDRVYPKIKGRLKTHDHDLLSSGETVWRNATRWARADLVRKGLLKKDSPNGVWEISDAGRKFLKASQGSP